MTELQILSAVKNCNGSMQYTALLNQNLTDVNRDPAADEERINIMIKNGLLKGKTDAFCNISITKPGRMYLQDAYYLEEEKQKLADDTASENTKKNRHDWHIAIVGAIIASFVGLAFDVIAHFFFG